ncbi:DUF960 family protein [Clostridium massiliamazoniense]|uniref:DUF960 family protein n=1 Tax=Clostridium massiliamazoniense TaxID=1347366 RepID=UPI0006D7C522|nr:DUF960 family protein [Clostridium massiliamazoniense]
MFSKSNRYVTRGVNEEVDIRLQLIMWSMIDKLKSEGNVEIDYLKVFKIRKEGIKVYIIDNGDCSIMLFPWEY